MVSHAGRRHSRRAGHVQYMIHLQHKAVLGCTADALLSACSKGEGRAWLSSNGIGGMSDTLALSGSSCLAEPAAICMASSSASLAALLAAKPSMNAAMACSCCSSSSCLSCPLDATLHCILQRLCVATCVNLVTESGYRYRSMCVASVWSDCNGDQARQQKVDMWPDFFSFLKHHKYLLLHACTMMQQRLMACYQTKKHIPSCNSCDASSVRSTFSSVEVFWPACVTL